MMKNLRFAVVALVGVLLFAAGVFAESNVLLYTSVPLELATNFADQFMAAHEGITLEGFGAGCWVVIY